MLQGSTLTFQLTSLVASDNLDVTSQKKKFARQALMLARSNNSRITSKT